MAEHSPSSDGLLVVYGRALQTIADSEFDMKPGEAMKLMRRIAKDALDGRDTFDKNGRAEVTTFRSKP